MQSKVWVQPYDKPSKWTPSHENYFTNATAPEASAGQEGWCFPLLATINSSFLLLSEAALNENYFAAHIQFDTIKNAYVIRQPEQTE